MDSSASCVQGQQFLLATPRSSRISRSPTGRAARPHPWRDADVVLIVVVVLAVGFTVLGTVEVEGVQVGDIVVVRIPSEQLVGEQDLAVRTAGGGSGVRDVDPRVVLAVHADDAEPRVLLLDEHQHRVVVGRGFTGQVGSDPTGSPHRRALCRSLPTRLRCARAVRRSTP
jgi:hypothetical protein